MNPISEWDGAEPQVPNTKEQATEGPGLGPGGRGAGPAAGT